MMIKFQQRLIRRLLIWGAASISLGVLLHFIQDRFWRGLGHQFLGWGIVDTVIAWIGGKGIRRQQISAIPENDRQTAKFLVRLLATNAGLDSLYMLGGIYTITKRGAEDDYWRGAGWGITIQGGFLFIFDLVHWFLLRR